MKNTGSAKIVVILLALAVVLGVGTYVVVKREVTSPVIDNGGEEFAGNPSLVVLNPNGGEVLRPGSMYQMRWSLNNFVPSPGTDWSYNIILIPNLRGDAVEATFPYVEGVDLYNWKVREFSLYPVGESYLIKICLLNLASGGMYDPREMYCDESNASFMIQPEA